MKHLTASALFIFLILRLVSQPAQYFYGAGEYDLFQKIVPAPDGNYFILGSKNDDDNKVWLCKITADGDLIWQKTYTSSTSGLKEFGYGLTILSDGDLIITGEQFNGLSLGEGIALVIKTDAEGNQIWKHLYTNAAAIYDAVSSGDGFLLTGWIDYPGPAKSGVVMYVNENGNLQWEKIFNVSSQTYGKRIFSTSDGNYVIAGRMSSSGLDGGIFLLKIEPNGDSIWQVIHNTGFREEGYYPTGDDFFSGALGACQMPDGKIWITNPYSAYEDISLMEFSDEGVFLQEENYGNSSILEYPYSLNPTSDGGWLICGRASPDNNETSNGFALRIKENGAELWRKYYGDVTANERIFSGIELPDGQFLLAGMSDFPSGSNGDDDGWLVHVEANGNALPWKVEGRVVLDINNNCIADADELPASNWFVNAENASVQHIATNANGEFIFYTNDATTVFTLLDPDQGTWQVCNNEQSVTSNSSNPVANLTFFVQPDDDGCSDTEVSLTQPDLMRCDTSRFFVTIANHGSGVADDLILTVSLDPALSFISASLPYAVNNSNLTFELPQLSAFQSQTVEIWVRLACDVQLGATHPIIARISPSSCTEVWDGPFYTVEGSCDGEYVHFYLQNTGIGDNSTTSYRVLADYILVADDVEISLPAGHPAEVLGFPADGRTWRVELNQAEGYPGASYPSAVVEGCGLSNNQLYSIDYSNARRFDDEVPEVSAVLPSNTTGNPDKVAEAVHGLGLYNLIDDLRPLEFTVRIQNPLEEMGDSVDFRLTFSPTLDVTTFRVVASNKPVEISINEESVISAKMYNLQLDTGTNAASSTMIRFRISPFPETNPDAQAESLFFVESKAFVNKEGPFELISGFLNYSTTFTAPEDEYNTYPPEISVYGSRNYTFGITMAQSADGAVFLGGETMSYSDRSSFDGLLIKTDENGHTIWLNAFDLGDGGFSSIKGIFPTESGGCVITGNSYPAGIVNNYLSVYTPFIAGVDQSGHLLWRKYFRPAGDQYGAWVNGGVGTSDGGFVIYGYTEDAGGSGKDHFYRKINANGDLIWENFEEITGSAFRPYKAILMPDGGLIFAGDNNSTDIDFDIYFEKTDTDGNVLWNKGHNGISGFSDMTLATDGGFILCGSDLWEITENEYVGTPEFIKFNNYGYIEWVKKPVIGTFKAAFAYCISQAPGEGYLVGGEILTDTLDHFSDIMLLKIDDNADTIWSKSYGAKNTEWAESILVTNSNQILLWGFNQSRPPLWDLRALLVHTNDELILGTDVTGQLPEIHNQTYVFPNPAKGTSHVLLSPIPANPVEWQLFDLMGRVVKNGNSENGIFEIEMSQLPSGYYFIGFPGSEYPSMRIIAIGQ